MARIRIPIFGRLNLCCKTHLDTVYEEWLTTHRGTDHPWMEENLEMILRVAVRSSIPLQTSNTAVRVARLDSPDHGFTWAQRIPTTCSRCRLSLSLVVLTSNSMLFILRMLYIATTLFETVE